MKSLKKEFEKIKKEVLNEFKWKVDKKLEKIGDNNFIQTKHVVSLIKCFNDNLAKAIDLTIEKTTKNVKSAVQLVLQEMERLKSMAIESSEGRHSGDKEIRKYCNCVYCGMVSAYENSIRLIKKAFSGVIEE